MDKQLREDLKKILDTYLIVPSAKHYQDNPNSRHWEEFRLDELESYINDNYVSKDKAEKIVNIHHKFMEMGHLLKRHNEELKSCIEDMADDVDDLLFVPTPESLVYDL